MPRGGYFLISLTHGFSFPRNHLFFFFSYYFSPQDLLSLSIVSVGNLGSAVQVSNAFTGTTTTGTISGATTTGGATSATTVTLPTALPTLLMRHNDTIPVFNDFFGTPGISAGDAAYVICAMDTVRVRDRCMMSMMIRVRVKVWVRVSVLHVLVCLLWQCVFLAYHWYSFS